MLPRQAQEQIERDQRTVEQLFPVGSWWRYDGRVCVAGRLRPRYATHPLAGIRNVHLYALDFDPSREVIPISTTQLAAALVLIKQGRIVPFIEDDLSGMTEAEQDYWRTA